MMKDRIDENQVMKMRYTKQTIVIPSQYISQNTKAIGMTDNDIKYNNGSYLRWEEAVGCEDD